MIAKVHSHRIPSGHSSNETVWQTHLESICGAVAIRSEQKIPHSDRLGTLTGGKQLLTCRFVLCTLSTRASGCQTDVPPWNHLLLLRRRRRRRRRFTPATRDHRHQASSKTPFRHQRGPWQEQSVRQPPTTFLKQPKQHLSLQTNPVRQPQDIDGGPQRRLRGI